MPLPGPPLPAVLGRYDVGVKVGGGGMAEVYIGRGVADDGTEELVALKVMRTEHTRDLNFLRMFSDEAKILARLDHPNVIRVLDSGIAKEHRYIVMELLAGRTLAEVWDALSDRGERMSLAMGAWICARIADGLQSAHDLTDSTGKHLGVVHRDVNPSNIFLTHAGVPKLIDFGLAKARARRTESTDGIVKGKIPYLAPEMLKMKPFDHRIDLYALGTTLWEVGTMKRLFKRSTDIETLKAIRDGVVPDPRAVLRGYDDWLASVTLRALAHDPDHRYASANDLRDDLDVFVGDDSSMAAELAALIARLFPGEAAQHTRWERDAIATRALATVPPPPMPFPSALSSHPPAVDEQIEILGEVEIDLPEED